MTAADLPVPSPVVSPAPDRERWLAIGFATPAALVLVVLFALPLALLFTASVAGPAGLTLSEYAKLATPHYLGVVWNSLRLALLTTGIAFLIGYPASFALARARGVLRSVMLASLFLPLAASVIVKAFAWTILLRSDGLVNTVLMALGLVDEPIRMIFTETALVVGAVNIFLPFMILPIYAVVAQLDHRLVEAAATLGASPAVAFVRVVMPLTLPGIVAGLALVFSLSVSAYVVPTLLIGERYPTLSTTIAKAFLLARQPGFGAAAGVALLAITLAAVALSARLGRSGGAR
ncbi:ABC transporter permease [Rhodoplanes roseus]|uniref:ABC transporter permease n=1 Tax=Rhodoplanes roseus TaxID=29409 RepID=A0A327KXY6_9BRAD|nr:ABC transporter permease [Rhodoplanes roseus]RAI42593.1 ABC transporter permease [Rhodoplanes roseus]